MSATTLLSDETSAIAICAEGAVLSDVGDTKGAIARFRAAVAKAPSLLALHLILANAERISGDVLGARATLRHALRVAERQDALAEFELGKALVDAGAGADAVSCFRRVRAEFPHDPAAAAALAAALREAQQPDEAWLEVQHALALAPRDAAALTTAATIRHDIADYRSALDLCTRSLALRPESDGTRVTRGYIRHLLGDTTGGWEDFEARALPVPASAAVPWDGSSLEGKSLLVIGEQGAGDQFQFLRFVRHPALRQARRVIVTCQPDAVSLLRAAGFDAVARGTAVDTDVYVPLLSLPLRLGVRSAAEMRGDDMPYLAPVGVARRAGGRVHRVGLVWSGNPEHRNDAARSIPASGMLPLLTTHHALQFVCMQHHVAAGDMPPGRVEMCAQGDWLATALQLCTLDVLISVDTGIAHLAGALGVPVWLLLPHVPDWRWGAEGRTTPWYRSARLFRQPARGDWTRVLTNVSAALGEAGLPGA